MGFFDYARFLVAVCTMWLLFFVVWNVVVPVLMVPLVLPAILVRSALAKFKTSWGYVNLGTITCFPAMILYSYLTIALIATLGYVWQAQLGYSSPPIGMLLVGGIAGCLLVFGNYTSKAKQERALYAEYSRAPRWDTISDRWMELREQLPLHLAAALLSVPMLVLALFVPSWFVTGLTRWLMSLNDYVQQVPILPVILAVAGVVVALSTVGKFLLYVLVGGAAVTSGAVSGIKDGWDHSLEEVDELSGDEPDEEREPAPWTT